MALSPVDHEAPCLEVVLKHGGLIAPLQVRPAIHIKDVPTLPYRILAKHIAPGAAGFLPCRLDQDGRVRYADPTTPDGTEVVDFVRVACREAGLATELVVDGGEVFDGMPSVLLAG